VGKWSAGGERRQPVGTNCVSGGVGTCKVVKGSLKNEIAESSLTLCPRCKKLNVHQHRFTTEFTETTEKMS